MSGQSKFEPAQEGRRVEGGHSWGAEGEFLGGEDGSDKTGGDG